jgi:hypothetical protein
VAAPRIDQINVVVTDVAAATSFLEGLGVEMPPMSPEWLANHRGVPSSSPLEIDLDSAAFAHEWGGISPLFTGVVLNLRVGERSEVDRLHDLAPSLGGQPLKAPYDAFWGARYAVVSAPGPMVVGLMSEPDQAMRSAPPDPTGL